MTTTWRGFILGLGLTLAACSERPLLGASGTDTDDGTTTTGGGTAGSGPTSQTGVATGVASMGDTAATTTTTTGEATSDEGTTAAVSTSADATSVGFIPVPDVPPDADDCDGYNMPNDSCPEGQKCTFEGEFGDTHCVEVVEDPKDMYEPCQILEGDWLSGFDDCGPGLFCWDVDPDTGFGECVGFCVGSPNDLDCVDPGAICTLCQECAIGLCLPGCDPLLQDCDNDDLCIANPQDPNGFLCVLDASGEEGQAFDPCEYANGCDKGLICVEPMFGAECDPMALGCCLPFCDTTDPMCPGAGQECLPWYEMGMAPPGYENVGLCGVPQ